LPLLAACLPTRATWQASRRHGQASGMHGSDLPAAGLPGSRQAGVKIYCFSPK